MIIATTVGEALMGKERNEAYALLEEMASNSYKWQSERVTPKKGAGVYEPAAISTIQKQHALLTKQLGSSNVSALQTQNPSYDSGEGGPTSNDYQVGNISFSQNEQANYVNNFQRSNNCPYFNTYTPAWRNHPNLSWGYNNASRPNNYQ